MIRASFNRKLDNTTEKLFDHLAAEQIMLTYTIEIENAARKERKAREALMELRYKDIEIQRSVTASKNAPKAIKLYIVEAKESETTVPKGEQPISWRILTTHRVETPDQAKTVVEWYSHRWFIQQVFRLMKKKGFAMEDSELETG
ncbi:hypothetical protein [Aquimarina aggregata]|uniref:hypothetical protein n=1 Tax=Aquimarina aggregata TaxID=1642818 RepID=UPI00249001DA|nr:hypothetical protein [Aquimarina aggregata]